MKWIDIPPVWLACFLAIAFAQSRYASMGLTFPGPIPDFLGGVLVGAGLLLIALAAWEFRRKRTTIIPHNTPSALVTSGIFSRSRNPIYLADILIFLGLILRWDAVLSLPLVPVLLWIIERRFVIPEESRMRREFRADFARYERKVRRWL
ncbi:methyltransferase family protein [Primorskyibacter sp. S187A]|uniref:methyltransferase family protein n=1 Tax=Primorskyibacter sp. S187A TaxID=3415130 RepID=UPI003C7BCAF7